LAVADKYQGKPIAFIAINSGNSPQEVAKYLRTNGVSWPTIVDPNRVFEKSSDVGEISLQNIWQFRTLDSEGRLQRANDTDLETSIDRVLAGAAWNVDPTTIPESLQKAWFAVEFGNYAAAAKELNRALSSRNQEIKAAAESLNNYVQKQLSDQLAAADQSFQDGHAWAAYKAYTKIENTFEGYQFEVDIEERLDKLKDDAGVKSELDAFKQLESVRKQNINSPAAYKRAVAKLQQIVKEYALTEAAEAARQMLESTKE
jgi:hypothetical protein